MIPASSLARRRLEAERMDDPRTHPDALRRALAALSRVHRLSGTGFRLRSTLDRIAAGVPGNRPVRVLDVACGGGDAALDAAAWGARRRRRVEVVALDRSTTALTVVAERARRQGLGVVCREGDAVQALPGGDFDLVFSSLFLHHLGDDAAVEVVRACASRAAHVLVEDLRRSWSGLLLAHVTLRLVSRSRVAWHDGPASVRAGWRRAELEAVARRAGIPGATVRGVWPQRWALEWAAPTGSLRVPGRDPTRS
jgi:2-polyprenyl-3-methyl-5-hydroxy-6-metoxy-1,4-benzoquinol methylase